MNIYFHHIFQMLSLLEHMYHELDLVKEFNMNPITLKRWLVRNIISRFQNLVCGTKHIIIPILLQLVFI